MLRRQTRCIYLSPALLLSCADGAPDPPPMWFASAAGGDASYDTGYSEGLLAPTASDSAAPSGAGDDDSAPGDGGEGASYDADSSITAWDASIDAPPCVTSPRAGDLAIVELMIASQGGSDDHGEWVEVQSQRDCAVDLKGLHAESPRGTGSDKADVQTDLWLEARGTFLLADGSDPALNHGLQGPLVTWAGQPADVLRNSGDSVTLSLGGIVIDSVTYPANLYTVAASISFPADCALLARSDWSQWQASTASWTSGFLGTPNAPNTDVTCRAP